MVKAAARKNGGIRPGAGAGVGAHSERRDRFVQEYVKDFNATAAAKRAGYSPKTAGSQGHDLLKVPEIQARIAASVARIGAKHEITAERIAEELACIGFSNPLDFICVTGDKAGQVDLSKVTRAQAAAISEFTVRHAPDGKGKGAKDVRITKLKLAPKREALVDLGRYIGMFKEEPGAKLQVTFVIDGLEEKAS